jgi:hypothetical protein
MSLISFDQPRIRSVSVQATASDKSGIDRVEFYVDWELRGKVSGPPYSFNLTNLTSGSHTLAAMAYIIATRGSVIAMRLR